MANSQSMPVSPSSSNHGTPQSENQDAYHHHASGHHGSPVQSNSGAQHNAEKRVRACDSCRGLKVRCDPSESDPTGPCKRCSKAGRECVFTAPTRKRQKKADTRVAELERKIDALTASLKSGGRLPEVSEEPRVVVRADSSIETAQWKDPIEFRRSSGASGFEEQGAKRRRLAGGDPLLMTEAGVPITPNLLKEKLSTSNGLSGSDDEFSTDVIDKNLLTMETAEKLVYRYKKELYPGFPMVPIPEDMTAARLRVEKPILFLAILAASSNTMHQALNRELHAEIIKKLAKKVVIKGKKSIEIVQALTLVSAWYFPPAHFERLNFYQLTHMASTMAIDLGLAKGTGQQKGLGLPREFSLGLRAKAVKTGMGMSQMFKQNHVQRMHESFPDPVSLESKRTYAACFIQCAGAALNMRRPTLLRYTKYTGECLTALEEDPEATENDKLLAAMGRLFALVEHVSDAFENSDEGAMFAVAAFTRKCDHWREKLTPAMKEHSSLQVIYHSVVCYVQESALRNQNFRLEDFNPPWAGVLLAEKQSSKPGLDEISVKQIESVSRLLQSAKQIVDIFINEDVKWIRATPSYQYVRAIYAAVLLSKVTHILEKTENKDIVEAFESNSELGNVEHYIEGLEQAFRKASEGDRCYTSTKFLFVIGLVKRIRQWKKTEDKDGRKQCLKCLAHSEPGKFCKDCPPPPDTTEKPPDYTMPCGLKISEHMGEANVPGGPDPRYGCPLPTAGSTTGSAATPLEMLSNAATSVNGANGTRYYHDSSLTDSASTPAIPTPQSQDTQDTSPDFSTASGPQEMPPPGAYGMGIEVNTFGPWDTYEFADPMGMDWSGDNPFANIIEDFMGIQ